MKKISTPLCYNFFLLMVLVFACEANAQNIGFGTLSPDHKLHVSGNTSTLLKLDNTTSLNTGIMSELYFKTGTHYTGAVKTIGNGTLLARLGFFTYAATNPNSLLERMSIMDNGYVGIGTNTPGYLLDVNGRMRVRNGNGTAGIYFMDAANSVNRGFVGMEDDNTIGLYGQNGGGWGLTMSTISGDISMAGSVNITSQLGVSSNQINTAYFGNYSGEETYVAVEAEAASIAGKGKAIEAEGGETGVVGFADMNGTGHRYGLEGYGKYGTGSNYGVYANGVGGNSAIGVYGTASGGTTNWGGYFSGNVYTTGNYQGSDRKLKSDIQRLNNAMQLIKELRPSTYLYKTDEYKQMELQEGTQYGLIADEVKQVFPSIVKQAVQPAKYENDDRSRGKLLTDEVSFEAVNYTAMIPVLIAAMQEQQAMIEAQQRRIEELEEKIK